jgi:hypothetical protein
MLICRIKKNESGFALPFVLIVLLFCSSISAMVAVFSIGSFQRISNSNALNDALFISQGGIHAMAASMSQDPTYWRDLIVISKNPANYTRYSPLSYAGTNGLPTCTAAGLSITAGCERHLVPQGGGLLKNFGSGASSFSVVTSKSVTEQLNFASPPGEDFQINGEKAWVQVERLRRGLPSSSEPGLTLGVPIPSASTQFRLTSTTLRGEGEGKSAAVTVALAKIPGT